MAQQLKVLTALSKNLSLIPSTYMAALITICDLLILITGDPTLSSGLCEHQAFVCMYAHTYMQAKYS